MMRDMSNDPIDLRHVSFEGRPVSRAGHTAAVRGYGGFPRTTAAPDEDFPLDEFISWVMFRAGLDPGAYRAQPLNRRVHSCLMALKVHSRSAGHRLLEKKPDLLVKAVGSLLIGVTEFFREPAVFEVLDRLVLPMAGGREGPIRVWSVACSSGAELYSMAILLAERGLLDRSFLLGTDCRVDAIGQAQAGLYGADALKLVRPEIHRRYLEPVGDLWRPIEALRSRACWKVNDVLSCPEQGPWDIILWRNTAIYLKTAPAFAVWSRLASLLKPGGILVTGKAERPPAGIFLSKIARCIYRGKGIRE